MSAVELVLGLDQTSEALVSGATNLQVAVGLEAVWILLRVAAETEKVLELGVVSVASVVAAFEASGAVCIANLFWRRFKARQAASSYHDVLVFGKDCDAFLVFVVSRAVLDVVHGWEAVGVVTYMALESPCFRVDNRVAAVAFADKALVGGVLLACALVQVLKVTRTSTNRFTVGWGDNQLIKLSCSP